jgi:hypothetical protein
MDPSHQHEPSVDLSPSFDSQSSGSDYFPFPDAMPHCQSPLTHINDTTPDSARNQPQEYSRERGTGSIIPRPGDSPSTSQSTGGTCEAPSGQYTCLKCRKTFKQRQGLNRHRFDVHEPKSSCIYCVDFKWGRPYLLRRHIEKQHPERNIDAALKETMGTRRRHNHRKASRVKGKKRSR